MKRRREGLGLWIATAALAVVFVAAAAGKLSAQPPVLENFHKWGFPDNFRIFVGSAELLGAIGLLLPPTATLSAFGLAIVMAGAVFTHVVRHEGLVVLRPLVLMGLLLWVASRRRSAVGVFFGAPEAH